MTVLSPENDLLELGRDQTLHLLCTNEYSFVFHQCYLLSGALSSELCDGRRAGAIVSCDKPIVLVFVEEKEKPRGMKF